ncbi:MAG: hypothetical protein GX608_06560 [Lentisphaerae bacterium]|nr:hypothetical protein [Lentisphaerota bacterium]
MSREIRSAISARARAQDTGSPSHQRQNSTAGQAASGIACPWLALQ